MAILGDFAILNFFVTFMRPREAFALKNDLTDNWQTRFSTSFYKPNVKDR